MEYIELFAGIGGFRYGIEKSNMAFLQQGQEWEKDLSPQQSSKLCEATDSITSRLFTCVYANEWDKYASSIYRYHYGKIDTRDITTVPADEIPDHDLLVGGFPCQAFSIAGKRQGFDDTRGTLFFEIARILKAKRTKYCLLENVKGLLSHDSGRTFQTILTVLDELGYDLQWQVLNSKNFGVPQNRERVFIIGHLRGQCRPEVFPVRQSGRKTEYDNQCDKATAVYFDDSIPEATTRRGRVMNEAGALMANPRGGIAYCLDSNYWKGQNNPNKCNRTVVKNNISIRRLTPIECERLQGFPDNWTKYGIDEKGNQIEISDTQRYKCLGNAVTTNVITYIGSKL